LILRSIKQLIKIKNNAAACKNLKVKEIGLEKN
jgi:hypothetical protein